MYYQQASEDQQTESTLDSYNQQLFQQMDNQDQGAQILLKEILVSLNVKMSQMARLLQKFQELLQLYGQGTNKFIEFVKGEIQQLCQSTKTKINHVQIWCSNNISSEMALDFQNKILQFRNNFWQLLQSFLKDKKYKKKNILSDPNQAVEAKTKKEVQMEREKEDEDEEEEEGEKEEEDENEEKKQKKKEITKSLRKYLKNYALDLLVNSPQMTNNVNTIRFGNFSLN